MHRVLGGIVLASVALATSVVPMRAQEPSTRHLNQFAEVSTTGTFYARLAPQNTEAEARSVFDYLQHRFPSVLGGYTPLIQPVSVGSGVLFFTGVGPFEREKASDICTKLNAANLTCIVRNGFP